jgi:hypothetical protein
LPVAERMALVEAAGGCDLPPDRRTPGTCRDFALMVCSILRERGLVARVRCGFATYLSGGPFEDHWICEYWRQDERRWARVDAQLDQLQREHLRIDFEPTDLPAGAFLNAGEAWLRWRSGESADNAFGQGAMRGAWFLRVNLMRDLLALHKRETSDWDAWRCIPAEDKRVDSQTLEKGDRIAAITCRAGHTPPTLEE